MYLQPDKHNTWTSIHRAGFWSYVTEYAQNKHNAGITDYSDPPPTQLWVYCGSRILKLPVEPHYCEPFFSANTLQGTLRGDTMSDDTDCFRKFLFRKPRDPP